MGMTIEEAKKILEHYNHGFCESSGGLSEPIKVAIETMRKYQKIQEIYQWAKDRSYLVETDDIMDKLKEVVEDGND